MSVSVVIADDQEMVRTGFRLILESQPDIRVVGEAADGVEAVEAVRRLRPDVCLMDIRMPKLDGLEATKLVRQDAGGATSGTKIVVVTTFDLDEYVYGALRAGASGFVVKNSGPRLLTEAVYAAVNGDSLISPSVTVRLLEHLGSSSPADTRAAAARRLTAQELKVVTLVARGRTNNEIAEQLTLALSTVKSHLSRIQDKLQARNRVEIAAWAWEHGIVG
ncbi:DNA-binding response regulator [Streptomyces sp. CB02959]|uniref:LuxR family transcriptional regulator n=1 Tax=Streptomyces noursei TaxID=1971 RepID=A0A2N8PI07_STRNR|nr:MULTISPECIES: response regulator transcription factor [Streptomyces]PJN35549.1 DNA-binding response regulator [Streptomyces sp. CB02959]PNE40610.1 LuxR family transcriptional regulator [Streptomyces noursei]